ncbi:MAG TPA: hypothetical protein VMF69_20690 [Gemmataceae bacterium]|nr:hypothetical protein [Gemmataceae bacterium]
MVVQYRHRFRGVQLIRETLLSVLMVCCVTDVACSDGKSSADYDVTLRRLAQIPPGTVIGEEAPKGWSHLIIKSYSRPGSGDVKQLSPTADRLTRLLFTAIVADVRSGAEVGKEGDSSKRYKLAKVAVGLGTRIDNRDTVITPDTQNQLGADLGLLARVVLRKSQEKLDENMVVARSAAFAVFDSQSFLAEDGKHKPIVLRYAILVDERTGRLNALVWLVGREADGKYGEALGAIQWLPDNLTGDCVLHIDGNEFSLGRPTEKAFAITTPPKGRKEIQIGDDLKPLAARPRFTSATAAELESKLREAIKN